MGNHTGTVSRLFAGVFCSAAVLVLLGGCGKEPEQAASVPEPEPKENAATASDPYQPGAPLPPNHPPLEPVAGNEMPADHVQTAMDGEMTGHPPEVTSGEAKEVEIVIPENIKGKWTAVQLNITGEDNSKNEFTVPIGGQTELAGGEIVIVDAFLPDYTSDFEKATSASDALNNPAVLVQVMKQDKIVAKGWVFKNYPEFNTFKNSEIDIQLLDAKAAEKN